MGVRLQAQRNGDYPELSGWIQFNHSVLKSEKLFPPERRWKKEEARREALDRLQQLLLALNLEEGSHKPRNVGGLWRLGIVLG